MTPCCRSQQRKPWKPTRAPQEPRKVATHLVDDFDGVPFSALCRPRLDRAFDCRPGLRDPAELCEPAPTSAGLKDQAAIPTLSAYGATQDPDSAGPVPCVPAPCKSVGSWRLGALDNRLNALFGRCLLQVCFAAATPFVNTSCSP